MSDEGGGAVPAAEGEGAGPLAVVESLAPAGWKAKLARAALQLIVGTEKGAAIYGAMRERIDTVEGRSIVSNTLAHAIANQAVNDPEVMERARARFLGDIMQRQENLEAVIAEAAVQLPQLPAPSGPDVLNEAPTQETDDVGERTDEQAQPLDPDWAATFTDIAENATTDELRERLAKVLAGELQTPGAFARGTLRSIAELERRDLELMQAIMPFVLGGKIVRVSGSEAALEIAELLPLADAGLIFDANAMLNSNWGPATAGAEQFLTHGEVWAVLMKMKEGQSDGYGVIPLTRTGNAVADLLGRPDERVILRRIVAQLNKDHYHAIVLGKLVPPNKIGAPLEQLFPVPMQVATADFNPSVFGHVRAPNAAKSDNLAP